MDLANFRLIFLLKLCFELIRLKNGIYASDTSSKQNESSKKNEASTPLRESTDPTSFGGSQCSTIPDAYLSNLVFKSRANRALVKQDEKSLWQMQHGASNYNELIMNGGIFIDKTMLIKYLLARKSKVYLITAPRRWGKTINLKMIQYFFEAPKTKDFSHLLPLNQTIPSYQLFYNKQIVDIFEKTRLLENRLLISEEKEIMEKHFGKHPVIHLDLMALEVYQSFEPIISAIKRCIQRIFKEHLYVAKFMENKMKLSSGYEESKIKEDLDNYLRFMTGRASNDEYTESIGFLCKYLNEYTTLKEPIILVDELDSPLLHAILSKKWNEENQEMLIDWFSTFLSNTFKKGSEEFTFPVLTGCIYIMEQSLYSGINNFKHFSFLNAHDIFFFYGFHQREVEDIMKMSGVSKEEYRKVRQFYDGYKGGYEYSLTIYNPISITNYIRERNLNTYWIDTGSVAHLLKPILMADDGQETLMDLITGGTIKIESALELSHNDLKLIKEILRTKHISNNKDEFSNELNIIFKMMFSAGYLTVVPENMKREYESYETLCVKIPNEEVKIHLTSFLRDDNIAQFLYGDLRVGSHERNYITFKRSLKNFLLTNTTDSNHVSEAYENLWKQAPSFVVEKQKLKLYLFKNVFALHGNEAMARITFDHTIIFELMLKEYLLTIVGLEKAFSFLGKQYGIDLIMIHEDAENRFHGTIIEYKFMPTKLNKTEQDSEHALSQCLRHTSYFLSEQLDVITVKCVGISIQENKVVNIKSRFMDSNDYTIYLRDLKPILEEYETTMNSDLCDKKYSNLLESAFHLK